LKISLKELHITAINCRYLQMRIKCENGLSYSIDVEGGAGNARPENARPENDGPDSFWKMYDEVLTQCLRDFVCNVL